MECPGENLIEAVSGVVHLGDPLWTPTAAVKPDDNRTKHGSFVPFRAGGALQIGFVTVSLTISLYIG